MNRKSGLILTVLMALVLTACASKKEAPVVIDDTTSGVAGGDSRDAKGAFGLVGYSVNDLEALGINGDPLNYTTVYFEYNSSAIDEKSRVIATRHAQHLGERGGALITRSSTLCWPDRPCSIGRLSP